MGQEEWKQEKELQKHDPSKQGLKPTLNVIIPDGVEASKA